MARKPRLLIADIPYHVLQRGNNKNVIFFSEQDYTFFLDVLQEAKSKHPCYIYSYCFMKNHFHLLIEPKEKDNISLLMKLLGAKYVHYINRTYKRTGTLWEGRYRCSMIDRELYFLTCLRYIEMNPVRAGIVSLPELYRWSSYRVRAFGENNQIIDLDPWYKGLGKDAQERQFIYRKFFRNSLPDSNLDLIREKTNRNRIIGDTYFTEQIEKIIGRKVIIREPGRPRKTEK